MRVILPDVVRECLFDLARQTLWFDWKSMMEDIGIPKSQFNYYRSGQRTIPEILFEFLTEIIPIEVIPAVNALAIRVSSRRGIKTGITRISSSSRLRRRKLIQTAERAQKVATSDEAIVPEFTQANVLETVGAFIGDGCFGQYNARYVLQFTGDSRTEPPYYRNVIVPALSMLLPMCEPYWYFRKRENSFYIRLTGDNVGLVWRRIGFTPGAKTTTVKIPDWIMESSDEVRFRVVRGIFDTDGCLYFDKRPAYSSPYPRLSLQTRSEALFHQLVIILHPQFKVIRATAPGWED
jgi:hypothetical protein